MIVFVEYSTVFLVLLLALTLGYMAVSALQGIVAVFVLVVFLAEVIAAIYFLCKKIQYQRSGFHTTLADILMSFVATVVCLFTSYLCMSDLRGYDDSLWGLICFVLALLFLSWPWLCIICHWAIAIGGEKFDYKAFLHEMIFCGVLLFFFFI